MEIWDSKPLETLWATPGLLRDSFTFYVLAIRLLRHTLYLIQKWAQPKKNRYLYHCFHFQITCSLFIRLALYNFSLICHRKTLSIVRCMGVSVLYTVIYNWGNFIKKSVRRACCFEMFSSYDCYTNFLIFLLKKLETA